MKKPKYPNLVLRVRMWAPERGEGYCHVRGFMGVKSGEYTGPYSLESLYGSDPGGQYKEIRIDSQSDYDQLRLPQTNPFYAVRVKWGDGGSTLEDMERGLKALRPIDKKLREFDEVLGAASTMGAWVARVALAMGAGHIEFEDSLVTPARAGELIDQRVNTWREQARNMRGVA